MIEIEVSILSADFMRLGEQAREAEAAEVEGIQIDVMDGEFVPNITFGPGIVAALRKTVHVPLDVHLMIVEPERYIENFVRAGADRIIVHQEAGVHLHRTLQKIRESGVQAGVTMNPGTPLRVLEEVFDMVDVIQIMTVNPGFGGQEFIQGQEKRISELHRMIRDGGYKIPIAVDGGINEETAPIAARAGASILVAGSSVFNTNAPVAQNVMKLRESVAGVTQGKTGLRID